MTNPETWIVYKTETMSAPGWENRKLLPEGAITDILCEEWDSSGQLPKVGERIREYTNPDNPEDGGITHGRYGDWVVTRINQFSSFDTNQRIVVCYCSYQPISATWEKLNRGKPVAEMLEIMSDRHN
ncbi:MAG TPA: hypothetical protein DD379_22655 [Cyanobacteria bacterium UBA11162]|nr:hypothetical protein [Cyanobacteria bacterium UBA11162]